MSIEGLKLQLSAWDHVEKGRCKRFVSYACRGAKRTWSQREKLQNFMVIYRYSMLCLPYKPRGLVFSTYTTLFGATLAKSKWKLRLHILWLLAKGNPFGILPFLVFPRLIRLSSLKTLLDGCFYCPMLCAMHRIEEDSGREARKNIKMLEKDLIQNAKVLGTPLAFWTDDKRNTLLVSQHEIEEIYNK